MIYYMCKKKREIIFVFSDKPTGPGFRTSMSVKHKRKVIEKKNPGRKCNIGQSDVQVGLPTNDAYLVECNVDCRASALSFQGY